MSNIKRVKSQAGFSLIELMVVVAIIGVLAAIAVPNFQRFQAKAKQSEARGSLAGYFEAQKAFYSEWQIYPGQFSASGYRPEGTLNYRLTGFNNASFPGSLTNYGGANVNTCVSTSVAPATCYPGISATAWQETAMATTAGNAAVGCAVAAAGTPGTVGTFTACAFARHPGMATSDTWEITQDKTLKQTNNGIL